MNSIILETLIGPFSTCLKHLVWEFHRLKMRKSESCNRYLIIYSNKSSKE